MALVNAKKSRTLARKWMTKAMKTLEAILSKEEVDRYDIEEGLGELNRRFNILTEAQNSVEMLLSEDELDNDIEEAEVIFSRVKTVRKAATRKLASLNANPSDDSEVGSAMQAVKLPKLELPKFKGDVAEWQTFWDKFKATVDASELPDVTKFTYLQSLLEGEARKAVEGLSLTSSHYQVACELLEERFGRKEQIVFAHIQGLLNLSGNSKGSKLAQLKSIQDQILVHVRSLEALEVSGSNYGIVLTPLILSRLPAEVRMEWARGGGGKESDLQYLLDFLKGEIERRERAQSFHVGPEKVVEEKRLPQKHASASALQTTSDSKCGFCHKAHASARCWSVRKLPIREREQKIKDAGLCFRCLGSGHIARLCSDKCSRCQGSHHSICCRNADKHVSEVVNNVPKQSNEKTDIVSSESHVGVAGSTRSSIKRVVSQLARVKLLGPKGSVQATVLLDSGSDRTYVSSKLVHRLGLKWVGSTELRYAVFGGGHSSTLLRNIYELNVKGLNEPMPQVVLNAVEVPVICTPMSRPKIGSEALDVLKGLPLADQYLEEREVEIDILVGLDYYWKLVKGDSQRLPYSNLVAQNTVFGWVVSGTLEISSNCRLSHQLFCMNDLSDSMLRQFWDLDSIGIRPPDLIDPADKVLEAFNQSIQYKDGRYEVALPWKEGTSHPNLLNNEQQARNRLSNLTRKLASDPPLKARYDEVLSEMERDEIIEEVLPSEFMSPYPLFYLPHRPVVKESSLSTKIRPVFDASARGPNNVSLNDCLEAGPSLIPPLVEVLIRFRRWKVALSADLTKAFLQIKLQRKDQDVHRFLWDVDGSVRVMRFLRVTFGNKASPFLLNATIRHHLSKYPPSLVIQELKENLYVDDWLTGADTEEEACEMFVEAKDVMNQAGMTLAKWNSNSKLISMKAYATSGTSPNGADGVKVLGVRWMPSRDVFSFDGITLPSDVITTKRVVLSFIARVFDPLGFLTPFIMIAKCLFQRLWQMGVGWDVEVPEETHHCFSQWLTGFQFIRSWEIPRCYSSMPWTDLKKVELHVFGDASERGYGAVVYLRLGHSDGQFSSSFVVSKAKVAPLKKVTLPRLELLGSLLAARLLKFAKQALRLPEDVGYRCWTDSTVALGWIRGDPSNWKQFVANRVTEIQDLTNPSHWCHCPGQDNPADLTTRGVNARVLVNSSLWLKGPLWLCGPPGEFPQGPTAGKEINECMLSVTSEINLVSDSEAVPVRLFETERWGTLVKAIRVVAWVHRFVSNARSSGNHRPFEEFTYEELFAAKMTLFKETQKQAFYAELKMLQQGKVVARGSPLYNLTPFIDENGLLRVRGRLQRSELSYDEKHPIILPKSHTSKLLVRFQHKLLKHADISVLLTSLRNSFWIIGARRLAKTVKRECVPCQRQEAKACNEVAAPLPELRVSQAPPFTVTGIDFAGPLFCVDYSGKKFYICLFTCAVIRGVHLELTDSLLTRDFVLAFKRFAARRGLPSVIYSDNAKTFKGAQVRLQTLYGSSCPNWKYIVPKSPWWGGWWERLVRSVKQGLRRSLGRACLTRSELETTLFEVENCINSRPLTFVGDEIHCKAPLTPNHFLTARGASFQGSVIEDPEAVNPETLTLREKVCHDRLDKFWEFWRVDYLRNLPPSVPKFKCKGGLRVGSIVLIHEDNVPKLQWTLGRVTKLFYGPDKKVRSVEMHTPKGPLIRSIQRLHELEYLYHPPEEHCTTPVEKPEIKQVENPANAVLENLPKVTRSGRRVKPVERLDV